MKDLKDLDKIIDFQIKYRLGERVILYGTTESFKEFKKHLNELAGNSAGYTSYTFPALPDSPVQVDNIRYGGFEFILINIDNL